MKKIYFQFVLLMGILQANAQTVTITADKDNTIYSESNNSNGAGQEIFAGVNSQGSKRRALIHFNVSSIPAGAVISAVSITLSNSTNAPHSGGLTFYKLTKNWGEGTSDPAGSEGQGTSPTTGDATWTNAVHPSTPWANAGGDFSGLSASIASVPANTVTVSGGTLVADVQEFVNNAAGNFGWVITGSNETTASSAFSFFSKNNLTNQPTITITYSVSLPIAMQAFSGSLQNNGAVLQWKTATEINNQYFEVERSTNGVDFSSIGRVTGSGNSSALHTYTFKDEHLSAGNNYYRLAQHDLDGTVRYSSIIRLSSKFNSALLVMPNPVLTSLNVITSSMLQGSVYIITSSVGQAIKKGNFSSQQINVSDLLPGQYWISIKGTDGTKAGTSFIKK